MTVDQESEGNINWPVGIAASIIVHAVVLGAFWMFSDGYSKDEPAESAGVAQVGEPAQTDPAQPAQDGSEVPSATPVTPDQSATSVPSASDTEMYSVKAGDSLSRIANRRGCTAAALAEMNGISVDSVLHIGQELKVPVKP